MKCESCGRTENVKIVKRGQMGKIALCDRCRGTKRGKAKARKQAANKIDLGQWHTDSPKTP